MALSDLTTLLALKRPVHLWKPWWFAAVLAPLGFWLMLGFAGALPHEGAAQSLGWLVSVVFWQPLIEELAFRGLLQGLLLERWTGSVGLPLLTKANLLTSVGFASAHLFTHPWMWAVGVFVVSLLFGYARERTGSLYPSMALHSYYNAGYFLAAGLP